jgi:hypothetical protein
VPTESELRTSLPLVHVNVALGDGSSEPGKGDSIAARAFL